MFEGNFWTTAWAQCEIPWAEVSLRYRSPRYLSNLLLLLRPNLIFWLMLPMSPSVLGKGNKWKDWPLYFIVLNWAAIAHISVHFLNVTPPFIFSGPTSPHLNLWAHSQQMSQWKWEAKLTKYVSANIKKVLKPWSNHSTKEGRKEEGKKRRKEKKNEWKKRGKCMCVYLLKGRFLKS